MRVAFLDAKDVILLYKMIVINAMKIMNYSTKNAEK